MESVPLCFHLLSFTTTNHFYQSVRMTRIKSVKTHHTKNPPERFGERSKGNQIKKLPGVFAYLRAHFRVYARVRVFIHASIFLFVCVC